MRIRIIIKWVAGLGLGLVLLAGLAWTAARLMPLSEEQRAAITTLEQPPEYKGRNAFGLLWTMGNAVPADRIEAVLAADAGRIAERQAAPPDPALYSQPMEWARDDYPAFEELEADRALFCGEQDEFCLARVRRDLEGYRALIDRHAARLDRIESLADYDQLDAPWRYSFDGLGIPPLSGLGHTRTRHALLFAEGHVDAALASSCRAIDAWRRLGRNSDSLILRMIANAYAINQHGTQLAELLTEIGPEQALPSVCDQALAAPPADELALCNAMRGEFEVIRDSERFIFAAAGNGLAALWFKLGYDAEANRGLIAQDHSQHCTADALVHIQADRATALPAGASAWRWSCLGNLIGCQIAARSAPAYTDYQIRMLDFGFQLRALATLAWLHREHPGESITEALLQARPDALKSPARELLAVDDGTALEVPLYSKYPRSSWHLPLRSTQ